MTTEAEARVACPTPDKYKYATPEAAERDRHRLEVGRGRKLIAYDTCPCGWVHLATDRAPTGIGSVPLTRDEIMVLDQSDFNQLVRNEVRRAVHPDTAKALRDLELAKAWIAALRLFQNDLNLQKQHRGGDRSPDVVLWRQRIDRVVLATSERVAEAQTSIALHAQRKRLTSGTLGEVLRSDEEIDARILRMMAGELAAEKLKRNHLEEFLLLVAAEHERFNIPLSKAMERAVAKNEKENQ